MKNVIILAGGKGERLRPHTENLPKPMVPLMGSPLLLHNVRWLVSNGYKRITICCGHLHEVITEFFGNGAKYGAEISYHIEREPLGRGGAFKGAMKEIGPTKEPILALNGDIFTNLKLYDLVQKHNQSDAIATLVSVPLQSPYGIVDIDDDGLVSGFREKPELPFWINAGIYVFNPEIINLLPDKGDHEELTFPRLAQDGRLNSYRTKAFWRAVDTVKDLTELHVECEKLFFGAFYQLSSST